MTTFSDLLAALKSQDPAQALIFTTDTGEIGAGYHVTELRISASKGIDCGGNVEEWQEARLQLLDGQGREHMSVGKFASIVEKSLAALPDLAQAPLLAEFGHNNAGLTLMSIGVPEVRGAAVVLPLGAARAVCKPAQRSMKANTQTEACCGDAKETAPEPSCCSAQDARPEIQACCT